MKLCEHSKHEHSQSNISPKQNGRPYDASKVKILQKTTPKRFQLKKILTRIGQSVHGDSEQSLDVQDIQGQMHQVGKK